MRKGLSAVAATLLLTVPLPAHQAAALASAPVTGALLIPRHDAIIAAMKLAADYYRPIYPKLAAPSSNWLWATYFQGVHALFQATGEQKYRTDAMAWGNSTRWTINPAAPNPDSVKAGQVYYDLNQLDPAASLVDMDALMAHDVDALPDDTYWWADALFMGLPNWTRWASRTGQSRYLSKMDSLYDWTRDQATARCPGLTGGLYDPAQHLWYRDCTVIGQVAANGQPVFWGRGNGWVIAALAQVHATLPAGDPRAARYADMLRAMADRLRQVQGADGFWRASLLDPAGFPDPETSATALIAYGIAYGVRAGLLDAPTYLPVAVRAWNGLVGKALQPSGFLSYVQAPGGGPARPYTGTGPQRPPTTTSAGSVPNDSPPYGVGALLLAGSELARLTPPMSTAKPVQASAEQVGNEAGHAVDGDLGTRWSAPGFPQTLTVDLGAPYRASNAVLVPYQDRPYRYRVETSTDGVSWSLAVDRTANTRAGTLADPFRTGTVDVRYARLTVLGGASTWVSITEFGIYDGYAPRPNLARGRPAYATSAAAGHPADLATDSDLATFWSGAGSLQVDLPARATVDTVRIFSRAPAGPRSVALLVSIDGVTWRTLATATLPNVEGPHTFLFPPVPVHWLQLQALSGYGSQVQIEEFEAYQSTAPPGS